MQLQNMNLGQQQYVAPPTLLSRQPSFAPSQYIPPQPPLGSASTSMVFQEPHATKENEQEEIMQQINALQRKLTQTSGVKTQSGVEMLSVKQKLSSSKKRNQFFEEDTQIKPFKNQERDRETLQRELNAIDDQTRQFQNQYKSYKSGYKVSGSSQPMMMYNDSDQEDEEDRKIIE